VNILQPFTFAGLLFGAMIPYAFSALTMSAVGEAAEEMIGEIKNQVTAMQKAAQDAGSNAVMIMVKDSTGKIEYPNHNNCVKISTAASLKKMILPGCIVILSPLVFGTLFGYKFVSGMLAGTITSGIQIAFSASNTGGAWDNAKKFVEAGKLCSN